MKVIEKIRMAATIVFVVAIALAVAYHKRLALGLWNSLPEAWSHSYSSC